MLVKGIVLMFLLACGLYTQAAEPVDDVCAAPMVLSGSITDDLTSAFMRVLVQPCLSKGKDATVTVSSGGGNVPSSFAIYDSVDIFRRGDARLTTIALGVVASSAVIVYLSGDSRKISCNGLIYLHPTSRSISGDMTNDTLRRELEYTSTVAKRYAQIVSLETHLTLPEVEEMMAKGTTFNAQEAVRTGFADEIVGCN